MKNKRIYQRKTNTTIAFRNADITVPHFPFKIWIEGNTACIENADATEEKIYHNEKLIAGSELPKVIPFKKGDSFRFARGSITLYDQEIEVDFPEKEHEVHLFEKQPHNLPYEGFPGYKRSPRLIKKVPTEKIEINRPPERKKSEKGSIIQLVLPPTIMLCVTVATSILMRRGIFVVISAVSTVMSLVLSVYRILKERKQRQEESRVLLEYFNMRAYPSLRYKDRLIYYYTDPLQPGMIYWTYSAPPKLSLPVPVTKPVWEEVWEKAKQAGKAIGAIGMLAVAAALFADDAVGVVADDVAAVGIVLEALSLLRQAFSGNCDA